MSAKRTSKILIAASLMGAALTAVAQVYPAKPVRIITGGPGTLMDVVARHLGQRLGERWGQSAVVENRGGAGFTIGTGIAARSVPDGYTLVLADRTALAAAPSLYKTLSYDPVKDLAPITLVAVAPMYLVAHPSLPAVNLHEFLAYAKQHKGALDFASAGPGTGPHMTNEQLRLATGIELVNVQYKGGGAAMAAIVSGEAKAGFVVAANVLSFVNTGKLKAYAVSSKKRFVGTPDIPTADEAGLPGFESTYWVGVLAPAGAPSPIIARLNGDLVEILKSPSMRAALVAQGAEAAYGTPEEFLAFIKSETAKLKTVIERTGMRAE
jgi:tripartite-type tricarboxylate transporter receptor subunit TctC